VIGSGNHAFGYLTDIDHHLFQSPLSYYTTRRLWDMAPGYEQATHPDFSRPVTLECLTCHADQPRLVPGTLNTYQVPPFGQIAISCDRCHGPTETHLQRPVAGSILNPARLTGAARDSVCEQCHLAGEARVPNPGKTVADFRVGQRTEDVYTTYVTAPRPGDSSIKVISHSEQLALSMCARGSSGRLWCGTCHNPHDKPEPAASAAYFREKCLGCHAATLEAAHASPGRDCVACHMPQRPTKDGGHTAFTDHRIARRPEPPVEIAPESDLKAWRNPDASVAQRNLALALATLGLDRSTPDLAIRGFKMLNRLGPELNGDPEALAALGSILLTAKEPVEAQRRFARALTLRPNYAPYEVDLSSALMASGDIVNATHHAERALKLDPLLEQGVELLSRLYKMQGEEAKSAAVLAKYRSAMGATAGSGL
jgi:predicted CXXCH cytochrome family protein